MSIENVQYAVPGQESSAGSLTLRGVVMRTLPREIGCDGHFTFLDFPEGHPDIIARYPTPFPLSAESQNKYQALAEAVFELSDKYGIGAPSIGSLLPIEKLSPEGEYLGRTTYITASRISGVNMRAELASIPSTLTLQVLDKLTAYYEAAARDDSRKLYLADVSLRQCMYDDGSTDKDPLFARIKMFDFDPRLANKHLVHNPPPYWEVNGFSGVAGLLSDLGIFRTIFPDTDISSLQTRLESVSHILRFGYQGW